MSNDLFNILEAQHSEEVRRRTANSALIIAGQRVNEHFGSFLKSAKSEGEFNQKLALISPNIEKIVKSAATQEQFEGDLADVRDGLSQYLTKFYRTAADDPKCPNCGSLDWEGMTVHGDSNNIEGKCQNCGKRFLGDMNHGTTHKMEDVDKTLQSTSASNWDGNSSQHETIDLDDTTSEDAVSQTGSPKIDKGKIPDDGLKPIDNDSKMNPSEMQDIEEHKPRVFPTDGSPSDYGHKAPSKTIDADKPIGDAKGGPTKTYPKGNGAKPVSSKWHIVSFGENMDAPAQPDIPQDPTMNDAVAPEAPEAPAEGDVWTGITQSLGALMEAVSGLSQQVEQAKADASGMGQPVASPPPGAEQTVGQPQ